jgi:PA14 domain/Bacterial Ig domain
MFIRGTFRLRSWYTKHKNLRGDVRLIPKPILSKVLYNARHTYRLGRKRMGRVQYIAAQTGLAVLLIGSTALPIVFETGIVHAAPSPGGNTTTLASDCSGSSNIDENAAQPESGNPNVCLVVPTLDNGGGGTPNSIRILSVSGGTLLTPSLGTITLGASGTILNLSGSSTNELLLNFTPTPNNTTASFAYAVVDPDNTTQNSSSSTATIPITPVDVAPTLKTSNGSAGTGLAGTYYRTSKDLTTVPDSNDTAGNPSEPAITRLDSQVSFNTSISGGLTTVWGIPDVEPDDFSVRWTGQIKAPVDGTYTIQTVSDDGVRVWIDGNMVIDDYSTHAPTTDTANLNFTAGSMHSIEIDYYERGGGEEIQLEWAHPGQTTQLIPTQYLYPGIIRPDMTYVDGQPAAIVDDALELADVDSTNMASATITVSSNCQSSEDELEFTNQNGITGSYDSSTCTLTLTGSSSVAHYQAALRSVKYYDSNSLPDTDTRTLQFSVNDGEKDSNDSFRNIVFAGVDNPPVISEGDSVSVNMDEDGDPTPFSLTLDATDPDNQSISWSVVSQPSHGTAGVGDPGNSTTVSYTPDAHYTGNASFVVQASDGDGGTDTITVNVVIAPHSDGDGVSTTEEDSAPNSGDANNDGTPDSLQNNVTALIDSVTGNYAAVAVPSGCSLSGVSMSNQTALASDPEYTYPLGLANFTANCGTPGFTTTITQYYYDPPGDTFVLRKFVNGEYQTVPNATFSRQTIGGQSVLVVSYQATDGGPLDADGTANGIIVDPAGPAVSVVPKTGTPSTGISTPDTGYGEPTPSDLLIKMLVVSAIVSVSAGLLLYIVARLKLRTR